MTKIVLAAVCYRCRSRPPTKWRYQPRLAYRRYFYEQEFERMERSYRVSIAAMELMEFGA